MSYDDFEVDKETNEVLDEIAKDIDRKVKYMKKLKGLRCYLAGPIDHAEDDGVGWRTEAEKWFEKKKVYVFNPCNKPISYQKYKEIDEEKEKMMALKTTGRFYELSQRMREIVHVDLRMVDISDFVVVYLNPEIAMFGTIHELINSLHQRKPTLVVIEGGRTKAPNWLFGIMDFNFMFDDFESLYNFLEHIDKGTIEADLGRWVFFD
jgi:hypothetical protein